MLHPQRKVVLEEKLDGHIFYGRTKSPLNVFFRHTVYVRLYIIYYLPYTISPLNKFKWNKILIK